LLGVSLDEGFDLPLIEAAKHALPILARDIPVFREIAGEHAAYFSGTTAKELAAALEGWVEQWARGAVPTTAGMPWLTWEQSAQQLLDVVLGGKWDTVWPSSDDEGERKVSSRESKRKITEKVR
jgi:glycosyltransferase involved in cell wall biosynthesis